MKKKFLNKMLKNPNLYWSPKYKAMRLLREENKQLSVMIAALKKMRNKAFHDNALESGINYQLSLNNYTDEFVKNHLLYNVLVGNDLNKVFPTGLSYWRKAIINLAAKDMFVRDLQPLYMVVSIFCFPQKTVTQAELANTVLSTEMDFEPEDTVTDPPKSFFSKLASLFQ